MNNSHLLELQNQINKITQDCNAAKNNLNQTISSEQNLRKYIQKLNNQLSSQQSVQSQLRQQLQVLQQALTESQYREQEYRELSRKAAEEASIWSEEVETIKRETERCPLDNFEQSVLATLQQISYSKEILTQYDAGTGDDNSKFIDFVLVLDNLVIAIEAKCYKGVIDSVGDARNTIWTSQTGRHNRQIYSCWGANPYKQVKTYSDALLARLKSLGRHNRASVCSVVVLANEARISEKISSNINGYFRVTTLANLPAVIKELKTQYNPQNRKNVTVQRIVSVLNT